MLWIVVGLNPRLHLYGEVQDVTAFRKLQHDAQGVGCFGSARVRPYGLVVPLHLGDLLLQRVYGGREWLSYTGVGEHRAVAPLGLQIAAFADYFPIGGDEFSLLRAR